MTELHFYEKAIRSHEDDGVYFLQYKPYSLHTVTIGGVVTKFPQIRGRSLHFSCDIPDDADVLVTYTSDNEACWECLTIEEIRKRVMYELYGQEDIDVDGYEKIERYILDAFTAVDTLMPSQDRVRKYSFQVGVLTSNAGCGCNNRYTVDSHIPVAGILRTHNGVYADYTTVNGEIVIAKEFNHDSGIDRVGYMLPHSQYIRSITNENGWKVLFEKYNNYYFFSQSTGLINVEYMPKRTIQSDCCIEFPMEYVNVIVYWATMRAMATRGDDRISIVKSLYEDAMKIYQRSRGRIDDNLNKKHEFNMIPKRKY